LNSSIRSSCSVSRVRITFKKEKKRIKNDEANLKYRREYRRKITKNYINIQRRNKKEKATKATAAATLKKERGKESEI
jgi:hypothetical protein